MKTLRTALALLLLLSCNALAQDPPAPETDPAPAAPSVPPVIVRDIRVQTIGEERWNETLSEGLVFLDAESGKLCVADENDPHGRNVCVCRDIDWHTFTNDLKINGHRILYNDYWSQAAEAGILSTRFGTNAWLRLVGAASGTLANVTVDAYDPTNATMVLTAGTATGTLQVCTNLLEADAWQPAANATITASTDAATTWTISLLGTSFETYRVLAEVQPEAGIHAERPLHANQGITMGGVHWDAFPTNHATIEDLAEATNALAGRFDDYLPLAGGTLTNDLVLHKDSGDSSALVFRMGTETDNNTDWKIQVNDGLLKATHRTGTNGWATPKIAATTSGELYASKFNGDGQSVKVNSTNWTLGQFASTTTNSLAELEARAEEYWCMWWRTLSTTNINWIPTDWPARNVMCYVVFSKLSETNTVRFPAWSPNEPRTLTLYLYKAQNGSGVLQTADGNSLVSMTGGSAQFYQCNMSYLPGIGWTFIRTTLQQPYILYEDGRTYPSTSLLPDQTSMFLPLPTNPVAPSLSMAPALSFPAAPAVLQPEEPASPDATPDTPLPDESAF